MGRRKLEEGKTVGGKEGRRAAGRGGGGVWYLYPKVWNEKAGYIGKRKVGWEEIKVMIKRL